MNPKRLTAGELEECFTAMREEWSGRTADALLEHLVALSSLPEDVERDAEMVRDDLGGVQTQHTSAEVLAALSRLATAAARVPGLSERIAQLERVLKQWKDAAASRESERDAARQEIERLKEDTKEAEAAAHSSEAIASDALKENERLTARVAELEQEAATLRETNAMLEQLAERERNPRCQRQECVREREARTAGDARVKELTARLEKDATALDVVLRQEEKAEARATAAEAKVKELEGLLRESQAWMGKAVKALEPATTPAPGLREAVTNPENFLGPSLCRRLRKADMTGQQYTLDAQEVACVVRLLAALHERVAAAYDATPAVDVAQFRSLASELPVGPDRDAVESVLTATPEPSTTHADLAAVVEAYEAECGALAEPLDSDDPAFLRVAGNAEGAREVLRRATGGEVPEVLLKARVVEVLAAYRDAGWSECTDAVVRDLGLTLPTGPGKSEESEATCEFCGKKRGGGEEVYVCAPEVGGCGKDVCSDCSENAGDTVLCEDCYGKVPTGPGGGETCWLCKGDPDAECPECGPAPVPVSEALESHHPSVTPEVSPLTPPVANLTARRIQRDAPESVGQYVPHVSFEGSPGCERADCRAYILGVESGRLSARLQDLKPEEWSGTYHADNVEMLTRVAVAQGYVVQVERSPDPTWVYATFTQAPQKPRLSVVPTPEVPALAQPACGDTFVPANGEPVSACDLPRGHDGGHKGWCFGSRATWEQAEPEPAAPEVAWEGDGVRVLADGWWTHDGRHTHNVSVAGVLARALAEARRKTAEAKQKGADDLKRALDYVCSALAEDGATMPGGGLVGIVAGIGEVKRKAAEDMRERAAKKLDELAAEFEACADAQHGKNRSEHDQLESMGGACRHAARAIRSLPLEDK